MDITFDALRLDLRQAWRSLRRAPAFSALVVLSLGLGIGANTALFAVADGVLLRPLPYRDPGALVTLWEAQPRDGTRTLVSAPNFVDWTSRSRTMEQTAAYRPWGFVLSTADGPERVLGARASAGLFTLLGVEPIAGRTFTADEDRFGGPHVVLLGEGFWRRRFGADAALLGRSLTLNNDAYQVVGILPQSFRLPEADVYVPLAFEPYVLQQRGNRALTVIGRLKAGVTVDASRAEMSAIAGELANRFPDTNAGRSISVVALDEQLTGGIRLTVWLVWAAVAVVMLIAGANAANLLLARSDARRREMAIRRALGVSSSRLVRVLLTESVLLALIAGGVGLLLARLGIQSFVALAPATFPRVYDVRLDMAVFLFAFVVSAVTGAVFGVIPARRAARFELDATLKERSVSAGTGRAGLSYFAVATQMALSVLVLVGAGLLVRSFRTVLAVDLGFQPRHVVAMNISLPQPKYDDPERRVLFYRQLLQRVDATPGVTASGSVSHLPLRGARLTGDFSVEGRVTPQSADLSTAEYAAVSGSYFGVMGIPVRQGRVFTDRDLATTPSVIVINETMARLSWPHDDPIGQRVVLGATLGAGQQPRTIVGVVGDVRSTSPETPPQPAIYFPHSQNPWPTMTIVTRTSDDPDRMARVLRAHVLAVDPNQPVSSVVSLDQIVATSTAARRFQVFLVSAFAGLALVLTILGIYGVATYGVGLRLAEFGIRLAMGARKGDILWLAVRRAVRFASLGIAAGVLIALIAVHSLRGALFGVAPIDPLTFVAVPLLTAAVVALASALAGRRATGVDPAMAMRRES
jgi:putative ABC transport system permease protein